MPIWFSAANLQLISLIYNSNLQKIFDAFFKTQGTPIVAANKTFFNDFPSIASILSVIEIKFISFN